MASPHSESTTPSAPLRHRLRVELDAPVLEVWALVGAHERLAEYSAGIERVDVSDGTRVCHFHAPDETSEGMTIRERILWETPGVGYATSAEVPNAFGLTEDLGRVTLHPTSRGTMFSWEQHYHHADLSAMRASFDEGIADIGQRLVDRFGGRLVERFVDGS